MIVLYVILYLVVGLIASIVQIRNLMPSEYPGCPEFKLAPEHRGLLFATFFFWPGLLVMIIIYGLIELCFYLFGFFFNFLVFITKKYFNKGNV